MCWSWGLCVPVHRAERGGHRGGATLPLHRMPSPEGGRGGGSLAFVPVVLRCGVRVLIRFGKEDEKEQTGS